MKHKIIITLLVLFSTLISAFGQNWDINLLKNIHNNKPLPSDKSFEFISDAVTPIAFTTPIAMFVAGLSTHDRKLQIKSVETGGAILFSSALSYSIKFSVKRTRPYDTYPDLILKKSHGSSFSFPSGHTTTAFATATSLSLAFPKWYVIIPSYTYAGIVAYSRMHLGMHYPSDLLAGIIIGIGTSFLTFQADKWLNKNYPN